MSHGDRLKQLTHENSYGCFQVEILSSKKVRSNIGMKGYVCKKYLQDVGNPKVHTVTSSSDNSHNRTKKNYQQKTKNKTSYQAPSTNMETLKTQISNTQNIEVYT